MAGNAVYVWDFTLKAENVERFYVKKMLLEFCKSGTFQLEEAGFHIWEEEEEAQKAGYKHYQGRVSLKKKMRRPPIDTLKGIHWSRTSMANFGNLDYVTKNYTKIAK